MIWIGPHPDEIDDSYNLLKSVPPERWPWGPPSHHYDDCRLFKDHDEILQRGDKLYCNCLASAADDKEYGVCL